MPIAVRAKQSLTRRQLLVRSASTAVLAAAGGLAKPYLSRAADRPLIACGSPRATFPPTRRWCGRAPTAPRACRSNVRPSKASKPSSARLRPTRCRTATSPRKCCSKACPPGRIFSTACALTISRASGLSAKPQVGHFRTAPADSDVRSRSSGRAIPRARAGASIPRAAACAPTRPCCDNRPDFFIHSGDHIYADCPVPAELKLPNGGIWRNIVTEEKSVVAHSLDAVSRQLQIQPARRQLARLQRASADVRAVGRP